MFLFPLMLQAYKDLAFQPLFRGQIDGIESRDCRKILDFSDCFRAGAFGHV